MRRLHVFCHSMGNRLFCAALPAISKHLLLASDTRRESESETRRSSPPTVAPQIELATVTLLHPEHDLRTFIERDYDLLYMHCGHITIYLDTHDNALMLAELVNRQVRLLEIAAEPPPAGLLR